MPRMSGAQGNLNSITLKFDSAVGGLLKVDPTQVPPPNKRLTKKTTKAIG